LAAIDRIESIVHDERIDCGFERVDAFLFTPPARDRDDLEREYEAMRELDLGVAWAGGAPLGRYRTGRCLRVSGQAQIDPREFMRGLAGGITRHGGRVFAHAQASEIVSGRPGRV